MKPLRRLLTRRCLVAGREHRGVAVPHERREFAPGEQLPEGWVPVAAAADGAVLAMFVPEVAPGARD